MPEWVAKGVMDYLADIHVSRLACGPHDSLGNIVAGEGFQTLIDIVSTVLVAVEAHHGELGLDHSGANLGDTDAVAEEIDAHTVAEGVHGVFGGAIDVAILINLCAGSGAEVDDVATLAPGNHTVGHHTGDIEKALDIGVNHSVPISQGTLIEVLQTRGKACIIDQDVDVGKLLGESLHGSLTHSPIPHVERGHIYL